MIPSAFRSQRLLEVTNIAAVGLSMAAATATVFGRLLDSNDKFALATIPSTLVLGSIWAWVLRSKKTVGSSKLRAGWLLSVPLAAANASGAAAMLGVLEPNAQFGSVLGMALAGATIGVIFWGPALVGVLAFFGYPIARAQRLSEQGLSGRERGEFTVGLASAVLSALSLFVTLFATAPRHASGSSLTAIVALSLLGLLAGGVTTLLSHLRGKRRKAFVADVAAGKVEHFRLEATNEGSVLMRVVSQGQHYRVADFEEELVALDRDGEVTREQEQPALRARAR